MGSSEGIHRILVADDDAQIRRLLAKSLIRAGHSVTTVSDGQEALTELEATPYSLLITDQNMPRVKGAEVICKLRAGGNGIPVIFISSDVDSDALEAVTKLERTKFLFKPFPLSALYRSIQEIAPSLKC